MDTSEKHFKKQMDGKTMKEGRTDRQTKQITSRYEITIEEIKAAIMKNRKAAGEDEIPNEACIYGEEKR